jgi:hypothetical protein
LPDSIPIPLDLLTETRDALDAALRLSFSYGAQNSAAEEAARKVSTAKAKLDGCLSGKSDTIQRRSELKKVRDELLTLARRLEKVERAA